MGGLAMMERPVQAGIPLTPGVELQLDLPRDFCYAGLLLRLAGSVDVAAGGGHNGTLHDRNPWSFLNRIQLRASGGAEAVTLVNLDGYQAARISHSLRGIEPARTPVVGAGVATTAIEALVPLWFINPGNAVPPEIAAATILNPARYGKLTLAVLPGTATAAGVITDFINGGDRVVTWSVAPTLDVIGLQAVNVSMSDPKTLKAARLCYNFMLQDATAALAPGLTPFTQAMPTGNRYRSLFIFTDNEVGDARQPVDDALGQLEIRLGPTVWADYPNFNTLVQRNADDNQVVGAVNHAGLNPSSSLANPIIGCYPIDFFKGGRPEGMLDARNLPGYGVPVNVRRTVLVAAARQWRVVTLEVLG